METRAASTIDIHADISIITPELIGLNLTIIHGHDLYMVEDAINDILHAISVEHQIIHLNYYENL
jgi:ribosomal protein S19